jgi:hypothetical protein
MVSVGRCEYFLRDCKKRGWRGRDPEIVSFFMVRIHVLHMTIDINKLSGEKNRQY